MNIALYALLVSAGLGSDTGFGLGGNLEAGDNLRVFAQAEYVWQDKTTESATRVSTLGTVRYGRKVFGEAGASWRQTNAETFTKSAWSPLVGIGYRQDRFQVTGRYFLPDSSVNELHGLVLRAESRGSFHLYAQVGLFEFDDGRQDEQVAIGAGWRF